MPSQSTEGTYPLERQALTRAVASHASPTVSITDIIIDNSRFLHAPAAAFPGTGKRPDAIRHPQRRLIRGPALAAGPSRGHWSAPRPWHHPRFRIHVGDRIWPFRRSSPGRGELNSSPRSNDITNKPGILWPAETVYPMPADTRCLVDELRPALKVSTSIRAVSGACCQSTFFAALCAPVPPSHLSCTIIQSR